MLRPPRVAEGRLFEYNLRRADCLAGVFPPLPTNATTSLGALRPPAPGATSCQEGVGAGAAPRNGSALASASTAAAALAAVRAASALSVELWLRPSAADLTLTLTLTLAPHIRLLSKVGASLAIPTTLIIPLLS